MKVRLLSIFCTAAAAFAAELPDAPMSTMVGVLMDANCSAIQAESAPQLIVRAKKPVKRTSTRSRSADTGDKFENCKATSNTSDFAIHTDGKLFVLDEGGNEVVRQQVRNESFRASMVDDSGAPRWLTVTVEGRPAGERLTIVSLRR
jgi:hypothetical protein